MEWLFKFAVGLLQSTILSALKGWTDTHAHAHTHAHTCCLMILKAYNLWTTSDSTIPQKKWHIIAKYRLHFLSHYLTGGYWNQVQLHTKQCKKSLQHKLDVPSVGLLSSAQCNLVLPHFHQVKSCASKSVHIISHKPSNSSWAFIFWGQWLWGLWWTCNNVSNKIATYIIKVGTLLPWKWNQQVLPKC